MADLLDFRQRVYRRYGAYAHHRKNRHPHVCDFSLFPYNQRRISGNPGCHENAGYPLRWETSFADVEYRLVPLMVSVVKIGDELSAAALTRGLGAPVRRTNVCQIGFHFQDVVAALFCILCFIVFLLQKQLVF